MSNNIYDYKKWGSRIFEKEDSKKTNGVKSLKNSESNISNYKNWKAINEQSAVQPASDTPDVSANTAKIPTIEDAILGDILADIPNQGVGRQRIVTSVYNALTPDEISAMNVSIKNYSKTVFKNWGKLHEQYRFIISSKPGGVPAQTDLNVIAVDKDYKVAVTTDGRTVSEWKYMETIIAEVNAYNASVGFKSAPKNIERGANVKSKDGKKVGGTGYAVRVRIPASGNSDHVIQYALLNVRENEEIIVTKKGTPDTVKTEKIVAKSTGSKGFVVNAYQLKNDSTVVSDLVDDIAKQLEAAGQKQFTSISVVSSASNHWQEPVPATHSLDGKVLITDGEYNSDPYPGEEIKDLTENASKNKKLAFKRGEMIANAVKKEAVNRGIASDDAKVSIEWRVSDTGGKNDELETKTPGQYFKVEVGGFGEKETEIKGTADKTEIKLKSLNFDLGHFGIRLKNLDAKTPRPGGIFGIGGPKSIIVNNNGKFFAGGARGAGGNRDKFGFRGYRGPRGGPSRN